MPVGQIENGDCRHADVRRSSTNSSCIGPAVEEACCLVWNIVESPHGSIDEKQLLEYHEELRSCAELVGASVAEEGATTGVLMLPSRGALNNQHWRNRGKGLKLASAEDNIVRLGQLVCRWAAERNVPFSLRVGVHAGPLRAIRLPCSQRTGYFGEALSVAKELASSSERDFNVHMSKVAKDRLVILAGLSLSRSSCTKSFYLQAWSVVDEASDDEDESVVTRGSTMSINMEKRSSCVVPFADLNSRHDMSTEEFRYYLAECGVDIERLGKGHALSLEDFYNSVVVDRSLRLFTTDGSLEQEVEQVRVDLRARSSEGSDFQLQLVSEMVEDGTMIGLDQRIVIHVPGTLGWKEAVEQYLHQRFGVAPELQRDILSMDLQSYTYHDERTCSRSIPGIMTNNITHEVVIRVVSASELKLPQLGLPGLQAFTTDPDTSIGLHKSTWQWNAVTKLSDSLEKLATLLREHGINVAAFPPNALNNLYDEVYNAKYSVFTINEDGELERSVNIIKAFLCADILSLEHFLARRWEQKGDKRDTRMQFKPISMRMLRDQAWEEALSVALWSKVGLHQEFQQKHVLIDERSYRMTEEVESSRTYPGLKTVYCIHEVKCRIRNPDALGMAQIGLPEGTDFSVTTVEKSNGNDTSVTTWCWKPFLETVAGIRPDDSPERSLRDKTTRAEALELDAKRRVPTPSLPSAPSRRPVEEPRQGCHMLQELMAGKVTDLTRAQNAARRIRDYRYSCNMFFEDCLAAFPELALYLVGGVDAATNSGRTADDEYQRTIGALFAFYWLMRVSSDGAQSFCFGLDDDWQPLCVASPKPVRSSEEVKKRRKFLEEFQWEKIEHLFITAGLLKCDQDTSELTHDVDRTLSMLVLTAVHDIMKVQALLPVVEDSHGTWCGYQPGETVVDHDAALGYVLEFFPDVLPSFSILSQNGKQVVKFTQCKMEYNMGWLVQGEAPPGALFSKFKEVISTGGASQSDIAFYFTHWLTDLAGAEPCPQEGCEKFVLKFPQKVLSAFLSSFSIVQDLSSLTETKIFEDYLVWRWRNSEVQTCGPPPAGPGSIARLRLVVMAQGDSKKVLEAYQSLPSADIQVLDDELARTGCEGQAFQREGCLEDFGGPALLIYYAPALMQKAGASDPHGAMKILAEVFRQARELNPLVPERANETVTVRIDALKDLSVQQIFQPTVPGEVWVLTKVSSQDAQVQRVNVLASVQDCINGESRRALFAATPNTDGGKMGKQRRRSLDGEVGNSHRASPSRDRFKTNPE